MKQIFKKLPNILIIFCTALFMLSMMQLSAKADPSYYITNDGSDFQVSGGSSYATLTEALSHCTGDGSQVIQLGTAGTALEVTEVADPTAGTNALVNATYTGWLKIIDDPGFSGGTGLSARGKFDGLTITTTVNTDDFIAIRIPSGGALEITDSTSITIGKGTCVINDGTLSITGGTLCVDASGSTVIQNNSSFTMTGGSLSGAAEDTYCLNNQGTATISGGTITANYSYSVGIENHCNMTIFGNAQISATSYAISNNGTAVLNISGGTIESTETNGKAIVVANGTVHMSGGTVRAASSSNGVSFGIHCYDGQVNISGGEVSCSSTHEHASAVYVSSDSASAAVNIYGTANITGVHSGIYSSGINTNGTGAVYIHGGTVRATDASGSTIINQNTGLITIAAGSIESASGDGVTNGLTGTIKITGGSVSAGNNGIYVCNGGLIDISGGTVTSTGVSGTGINVRTSVGNQTNVVLSSSASIVSASTNTIRLTRLLGTYLETADLFGEIIHGSTLGAIGIKGNNSGSGTYLINSSNYQDTALTASEIIGPAVFLGWASDAPLSAIISTANGATISDLTTGANAGVTDIYLKAGAPVAVFLASDSLGTAGDSIITGLTSGNYYQVTKDSTVYYVRANGTLASDVSNCEALTGTAITGLTNGSTYKVELYTPSVILDAGSLGTAGNAKITGLTSGVKYKLLGSGGIYYVTAGGTVSNSAADLAELIGTEITGLANGNTYKVEVYIPSVLLGSGSLGTAGDGKITGLTPGARYMVGWGTGAYYIKANGTLSPTVADLAELTGTEITGLINDTIYYVIPYTYMDRVFITEDSPGTVDDTKITGLTSGIQYQVSVGSTVYYVKADGTLSTNIADLGELTGTEITGLTYETTYKVQVYTLPGASVTLAAGSLGTAGNSKITGLAAGTKYQVTTGSTVYYVKADGTLSASASDAAALTGTEITGLTNGVTYKVEVYTISETQPAGTGADADNPYLITTAGNLFWMSQNCATQAGFSGKYFKQNANIDLTGLGEFVPIGSMSNPFKGHYDGNNHKISKLYIHGSYSETGLFGDLKEGRIKNLTLEDVSISGNNWAVAGFVGYLESTGTVANCHITKSNGGSSSIEGTYPGGGSAIGGIAGENDGTIEYCSNAADITNHRSYAVGGIAGGSYTGGSEGIYNCYNSGAITGTTGTGALGTVTGGITGDLSGNISHCYNIGTVTVGQLNSIGGIVGKIGSGSILGNYFLATAADSGVGIDTPGINSIGATAKTSTELKTKSTFDGWNFTTSPLCWAIDVSSNSGYPFISSPAVVLASGSLGTAGDSIIIGLTSGTVYKVTVGSTVYYVKADGTLSASLADMGELAGTEVTGLVNGTTYKVELYSLVPAPANLTATAGNGQVSLIWSSVTGATGYRIYQSTTSGSYGSALDSVSTTVYAVTGLTNGTTYYFQVKAYSAAGDSAFSNEATAIPVSGGGGGGSDGSSNSAASPTPGGASGANILVNGQSQNAGTVVTSQQGSQTVTTVVVDQQKLEQKLASEGNNSVVTIPVNSQSDKTIGELNGQMVKNMESKAAVVELKTQDVAYTLPAQQINIEAISNQLGQNVGLEDIKVQIEISKPSAQEVQVVENTAQKGRFSIVIPPVQFSVKCTYKNQTIEVTNFNNYVERTIAIPDGVDPNKITTGVVFDPDGTVRHVPTQVVKIDDKYYAKINSLTNSTYSVIWNPIEFEDVADHWARTAINDMGSRMVVSGVGSGAFEPDRGITRAEFATVMVKALGLKPGTGSNPFQDVKASEWYTDFIKTAYEYKIISGYSAAAFGPVDKITREQAMTMIYKAMKITDAKVELEAGELEKLLVKYSDSIQTAEWARESMAACVKSGIVSGKSANIIGPRDEITRAEVAVMVRQLLQQSVLI